ncbi:Gfo/Idh/MocA family oxidoreductase [Acidobacteria bacterium AH-259-A15]|nr:Gfo/Idh/MocA family oxidoreductase [Acidobacteria bacterium AH-259-A15]
MTKHIGILGGGNISETHLRAAREIDGLEVSAVCGQNQDKVKRLGEMCQAAVYSDLEAFLQHRPMDMVAIGSPSGLHAEQGIAAARKGLHALVEKPIDVSTERADSLIAECEKAGVKLGVFFQDRVAPDIVRLKELIQSGRLGNPLLVSAHVRWHRPAEYYHDSRWRGTWALDGGGALMNQGVHTVDLLLWLLGSVRRVYARTATLLHDIEVEDTAVVTLEFATGTLGILEAATSAYPGYPRRLVLTGAAGTAVLEHDQLMATDLLSRREEDAEVGERSQNASASSPVVSDVRGHGKIMEDFLDAIQNDRAPICDGREGRKSVELVQAIYQSSRTGQAITLG